MRGREGVVGQSAKTKDAWKAYGSLLVSKIILERGNKEVTPPPVSPRYHHVESQRPSCPRGGEQSSQCRPEFESQFHNLLVHHSRAT